MADAQSKQRDYVRELARRVREIANSDTNHEIKRRWRAVNALRAPDRPPVWCRPVGAWAELLPEDSLRCSDPWLRSVERQFRQVLIKDEIGDDMPVDDYFPVRAVFDVDPPNIWGVDIGRQQPDESLGAWAYDPPIRSESDLQKLRVPTFSYNEQQTHKALAQADELLGDILPAQLVCHPPLNVTLCQPAAELIGLSQLMMAMAVRPSFVHHLMAYLRDTVLSAMRQVEETGLLTPNNTGPMTCSDPVGPESGNGRLTYENLWAMTSSQEFDQVSPAMWEEFLLNYQRPILDRFGLTGYGCCENLTNKIEGVLSIPNLRIFVCSAWTDLETVIERVGDHCVIMWRQKASDVVFPDDVGGIRRHLEEGLRRLKGCHVQVVLRELQTLAGHPDRLHVWTELAKEVGAKYA